MPDLTGLSEKEIDLIRFCVLQYRFQVLREAQAQRTIERRDPWGDAIGVMGNSHWSYDYAQRLQELADRIGKAARPAPSLIQRMIEWVSP